MSIGQAHASQLGRFTAHTKPHRPCLRAEEQHCFDYRPCCDRNQCEVTPIRHPYGRWIQDILSAACLKSSAIGQDPLMYRLFVKVCRNKGNPPKHPPMKKLEEENRRIKKLHIDDRASQAALACMPGTHAGANKMRWTHVNLAGTASNICTPPEQRVSAPHRRDNTWNGRCSETQTFATATWQV